MKANYPYAIGVSLRWEIGAGREHANTDNPGDHPTRDGVTQPAYNRFRRAQGQPFQHVFKMTDAERNEIYRRDYAALVGFDTLPSGVDLIALDCIINGSKIHSWLLASANLAPADRIKFIHGKRLGYWRHCPLWATAHVGWLARENDVMKKSLALAGAK